MKNKVDKVRTMLYIEPGTVLSINHMFYVRNIFNDVWMVKNGTLCGLNLDLWAPYFGLTIVQHPLRALISGYSRSDMDVGEMFLNFPLHPDLRPFSGVDITHIKSRPDEEGWYQDSTTGWERCAKNFIGLIDSPYQYLQLLIHVKFIAYGERKDAVNPFEWSHSNLNLSGDEYYTHGN